MSCTRSTCSSASVLFCVIVSALITNAKAEASVDGRKGLRRGYDLRSKQTSKLSPLLNSLGDSGFCDTICSDICLALDTKDCNDICNNKCNSLDSNYSTKSSTKQGQKIHRHATQALTSGDTCFPSNVSTIRIDSTTGQQIHMFQLLAYTPSGSEVASTNNNAIATQSSTYKNNTQKFGPFNAIDQDYSTFSHTDNVNAYWEVDLGGDYEIEYISIHNRYCQNSDDATGCLCRLTNATISLLDSQRSVVSSIDAGNTCGTLTIQTDFSQSNRSAKKVMIKSTSGEPIQLYELQAYSSGVNVAKEGTAIQSSTFQNQTKFAPSNAIDSNNDTFSHTAIDDSNPTLEIILYDNYIINDVVIINRWCKDTSDPNGCLCRLSSAVLTLFDENDDTIATRMFGNTCGQHTLEEMLTLSSPSTSPSSSPTTRPSASPSLYPSISPTNEVCGILEGCHDEDLCTTDTAEYVNGQWTCKFVDIDCGTGWFCDGSDGSCKLKWNVTDPIKINANDAEEYSQFGSSVHVSGDVIVIGAEEWNEYQGAAYVYKKQYNENRSEWRQVSKLTAADGNVDDYFGTSVSTSGDVVIVGAYYAKINGTRTGAAYIFEANKTSGEWEHTATLRAHDGKFGDYFGVAVGISGNDLVVVGASEDDDGKGSAYIFERNVSTGEWEESAKLQFSANDGRFGKSISISEDDVIVVGANFDINVDRGFQTGAAYIVERNGTSGKWEQTAKLIADDGKIGDRFGNAVGVSGNVVVVGANFDDDKGQDSGSIYIFERDETSGEWKQEAKLTASDGSTRDSFGYSVSISGDVIIVGAYKDDSFKGSAYIIEKNRVSGAWEQTTKLKDNNRTDYDYFEHVVSVSGYVAVAGVPGNNTSSGFAYIY